MLDNAIPQGFEDAVELRRKNRETVVKYMNTKGQDRLRRHELFVEDGCGGLWTTDTGSPIVIRGKGTEAGAGRADRQLLRAGRSFVAGNPGAGTSSGTTRARNGAEGTVRVSCPD